jgi:hypothetical protein
MRAVMEAMGMKAVTENASPHERTQHCELRKNQLQKKPTAHGTWLLQEMPM